MKFYYSIKHVVIDLSELKTIDFGENEGKYLA